MAAVSESIVREYFELHGFLVHQYRKYVAPAGRGDEDIDFLAFNPRPQPLRGELPFILRSADLPFVERAIIVIKAWHTEIFSPALLTHARELFRFLEKKGFQQAVRAFGEKGGLVKILVVPSLPQDAQSRDQSVSILRSKGIDAVISFRTLLSDLVTEIEASRNYQKSDLLQTIRILKTYDFLKDPQLELFKGRGKSPKSARRSPLPKSTPLS